MNNSTASKKAKTDFSPYDLLNWVSDARLSPGEKSALLALIRCADKAKNGNRVWPGQDTIAEMSGQGLRTVNRHVSTLTKLGYIEKEQRDGHGYKRANAYLLQVGHHHEPKFDFKTWKEKRAKLRSEKATIQNTPTSAESSKCAKLADGNTPVCAEDVPELAYEGDSSKGTKNKGTQPAAPPQGGSSSSDENASAGKSSSDKDPKKHEKKISAEVYTAWKIEAANFQVGKVVLTPKEKKQLKDCISYFRKREADPAAVVREVVRHWDRFKSVAKCAKGWSDDFIGGGMSPNPSTQSLLTFRKEAVDYVQEDELRAAEAAAIAAEEEKAKAKRKAKLERRKAIDAARRQAEHDFKMADPTYHALKKQLAELESKKELPDLGMTEGDCIYVWGDQEMVLSPKKAWELHRRDLIDEKNEYLRESGLVAHAREHGQHAVDKL